MARMVAAEAKLKGGALWEGELPQKRGATKVDFARLKSRLSLYTTIRPVKTRTRLVTAPNYFCATYVDWSERK